MSRSEPDSGWDVIVVGAGPAGSATAALLASAGYSVLLVDGARFPRRKPCAEYVSPGGVELLQRLGALEYVDFDMAGRWLRGMQICSPSGARHAVQYADSAGKPRFALSLSREHLDLALLQVARASGVEVREGFRITAPHISHCPKGELSDSARQPRGIGGVVGSRVDGVVGADGCVLRAKLVVGADGRHSVVARAAGPPLGIRWPRRLGLVVHLADVPWPAEYGEMHVGTHGYVGVAPLDNRGRVTVGLVRKPGRLGSPGAGLEAALADYPTLSRRLASGRPVGAVQGVGPLAHRVRACHGPGYLLVGDAAGFFDPFTGEGIFRALRGAELAAQAIDRALRARTPASAGPAYARMRQQAFGAKERLTVLIQLFVQRPWLMDLVVCRLAQRPAVARELGNVLGDLQPATLRLTWRLLAP